MLRAMISRTFSIGIASFAIQYIAPFLENNKEFIYFFR
jgi:hypothetical protein